MLHQTGEAMRIYTVYTSTGIYTNIKAYSEEHAKKVVWKMTLGREKIAAMTAVCTGTIAA